MVKACGFARASARASLKGTAPALGPLPAVWSASRARARAASASAESAAFVKSCIRTTLGGVSPCAQRRSGARRRIGQPSSHVWSSLCGGDMAFPAAELATPVPALGRAPLVFVRFLATQEMECTHPLRQRLLDRVGKNDRTWTLEGERRVEAGQIGERLILVGETVISSSDFLADAEHVEAQQTFSLQRRRSVALECAHRAIRQHARLAAALPSGPMQAKEVVEDGADRSRIGLLDGHGATAHGAVARHVDLTSLGFGEDVHEALPAFENEDRAGALLHQSLVAAGGRWKPKRRCFRPKLLQTPGVPSGVSEHGFDEDLTGFGVVWVEQHRSE